MRLVCWRLLFSVHLLDILYCSDSALLLSLDHLQVPWCEASVQPVINSVAMQLLSYHLAVIRGHNVDQPRNMAKSVTVADDCNEMLAMSGHVCMVFKHRIILKRKHDRIFWHCIARVICEPNPPGPLRQCYF